MRPDSGGDRHERGGGGGEWGNGVINILTNFSKVRQTSAIAVESGPIFDHHETLPAGTPKGSALVHTAGNENGCCDLNVYLLPPNIVS